MSNWNPLETAPVGESVLLAYKMGLGVAIGHKGEDGIWRGHEGTNWGDGKARFSHWMSEPEPPVAANHQMTGAPRPVDQALGNDNT